MPKFLLTILLFLTLCLGFLSAQEAQAYRWSVQYLIDQSRTIFGQRQTFYPRHNRSIALSPDGRFVYATYHHGLNQLGEVRKIDLNEPDYDKATVAILRGVLTKAVAVDDKNRVYIAMTPGLSGAGNNEEARNVQRVRCSYPAAVLVYDQALRVKQHEIETDCCEGVAVVREGGDLVLYGSEREGQVVKRWKLKEKGDKIEKAERLDDIPVPDSKSLRQIHADAKGRLWITDPEANRVFRIEKDRKEVKSVEVKKAMGITTDGDRVFVTRWTDREITLLDQEMNPVGTLTVPWEQLELAPFGNNRNGALSGIVALPGGGFLVCNERGQTANQKSTYGREDDHSGVVENRKFMDAYFDDNEPVLRAAPVATVAQ